MRTNKELVSHLESSEVLRTPRIKEAFLHVDRVLFVPTKFVSSAYVDGPLPIGHQATISQPWTVAFMLELLQPEPGNTVLDIGAGSGWSTALMAFVAGENGVVTGTELLPELIDDANKRLRALDFANATVLPATESFGVNGKKFDRILVSAAAQEHVPQELLDQLAIGGRMVIPVRHSILLVEHPDAQTFREHAWPGFSFVPLRRQVFDY